VLIPDGNPLCVGLMQRRESILDNMAGVKRPDAGEKQNRLNLKLVQNPLHPVNSDRALHDRQ
jgi:hypothetical protein